MSFQKKVLKYRLDIDQEFQGWILAFASLTAIWIFCMPCYCAGLQSTLARRVARWLSIRLPQYLAFATIFNGVFMFLLITWLPDWEIADYIKAALTVLTWTLGHLAKFMDSIVLILAFAFVLIFKERIALVLGFDDIRLFRFKVRDCLNCCSTTRFRPIKLVIWKVEDLPAADLLSANNVFLEAWGLGYNEGLKTRVHNNAGSSCIIKEAMHMNFDDGDEEDNMTIFVKHQGMMMGTSTIARVELSAQQVQEHQAASLAKLPQGQEASMKWDDQHFIPLSLAPRGTLYYRIVPEDEETGYPAGGFVKDLTTC